MRPDWPVALPVVGVRLSLWRAAAVYRLLTLVATLYLIGRWHELYARPWVAYLVGAGMLLLTAVVCWLAATGRAHRPAVVSADVVVTALLTLGTVAAQTPHQRHGDMPTLTTLWAAGPALEAGLVFGAAGGVAAGLLQVAAAIGVHQGYDGRTLGSAVLLVVAGGVVGYVAALTRRAEDELRLAAAERAAVAERERLARSIHDGVLQLLALVHRAGKSATGEWAELGAEAARQEAALRALVSSAPLPAAAGTADFADLLRRYSDRAAVSVPGHPVYLPRHVADELGEAVRAACDNVAQHAGDSARIWVLLEQLPGRVRVTVRDDGAGIPVGRLEEAATQGRLGVSASIRGRVDGLGGHSAIRSEPGAGTTVELTIPYRADES